MNEASSTKGKRTKVVTFERSEAIEQLLHALKLSYELLWIPMGDFDTVRSRNNQVRFAAIHSDLCVEYAAAMRDGSLFPPLIASARSGKYVIWDGNNRQAAAEKVHAVGMHAYVLDVSDETLTLVVPSLNQRLNGERLTNEELLQHGVRLVRNGQAVAKAASALGLVASRLKAEVERARSAERARRLGIETEYRKLPADIQIRLSNQGIMDEAFVPLVKVLDEVVPRVDSVRPLIKQIAALQSSAAQQEAVAAYEAENRGVVAYQQVSGSRKRRMLPWQRLNLILSNLRGLENDSVLSSLSSSDAEGLPEEIEAAYLKLRDLAEAIQEKFE